MPKSRTTCTRCSMRRQKCDRKIPCTRCVRADVATSCTRVWKDYDARVHRSYLTTQEEQDETQAVSDSSRRAGSVQNHNGSKSGRPSAMAEISTQPAFWPPSTTSGPLATNNGSGNPSVSPSNDNVMDRLQRLVPSGHSIFQLVEYYESCLSWHHGGLVCMPAFHRELRSSLQRNGTLRLDSLDMRWCALVFAIMGASITSAPDATASRWYFSPSQRQTLSREWYDATLSCLEQANYTARPHIDTIQAIEILSLSAHVLGFSVQQYILFGSALRMAQSLGLQRICQNSGLEIEKDHCSTTPAHVTAALERETSRRVWLQLCVHDWFSAASADTVSVNSKHYKTAFPSRMDEKTAAPVAEEVALPVDFGTYLLKLGHVLAEFHDATWTEADTNIRYEIVLKFDAKLRTLGQNSLPESFRAEDAPVWTRWARNCATTLQANKIILIHRSFLSQSFIDERYAYSRWASVSASQNLIREAEMALIDTEKPRMWNDQAHVVGASITLCLDMLHRPEDDAEAAENRKLITKALSMLRQCPDSVLASRGVFLIRSLLEGGRKHRAKSDSADSQDTLAWPLESREEIDALRTSETLGTEPQELPLRRQTGPISGVAFREAADNADPDIAEKPCLQSAMDVDLSGEMSWFNFSDYFPSTPTAQQTLDLENLFKEIAP